jgi:DNA invertase Pin-like site-specific DNA recombinase
MPLLNTQVHKDLLGTLIADLVLSLLSYCANAERNNIKKRQAEGIKSAKARGVKFGRPIKEAPDDFGELVKQWETKKLTFAEVLEKTGLKHTVFYSRLREYRKSKRKK